MDNIIVLNGKQFLIINEIEVHGMHYIYAGSLEDEKYVLLIEREKDGIKTVQSVTDEEEFELVMSMIAKENS